MQIIGVGQSNGGIKMLEDLTAGVDAFDSSHLLKVCGVMSLMPENASRAISLDAFAHAVASSANNPTSPKISGSRLRALVRDNLGASSQIGIADDPADQIFAQDILFTGGAYRVFPGPNDAILENLRWLFQAALLGTNPVGTVFFRDEFTRVALFCLRLSDAICDRANIARGTRPSQDNSAELSIPIGTALAALAPAITFTRAELEDLAGGVSFFQQSVLPLVSSVGDKDIGEYSSYVGELHHKPIVAVGDEYVVPVPSHLTIALRRHLLLIAQNHDVLSELAQTYHGAVWQETLQLIGHWDAIRLQIDDHQLPNGYSDGLFTLDSNKALFVQLITDDLSDYSFEDDSPRWDGKELLDKLKIRGDTVVNALLSKDGGPGQVLVVVLFQGLGRWLIAGFGDDTPGSLHLAMNASDFRTISLVDSGDPLGLWKYALAFNEIRKECQVIATGALDEYQMYWSSQHSYYFSDDAKPNMLSIATGSGLEVRARVSDTLDSHGVPSFHQGSVVEVLSVFGSEVPISAAPSELGVQPALVVEGMMPVPIWVVGPSMPITDLRHMGGLLVEMLAYWLWQAESHLSPLFESLVADSSRFVINLELADPQAWLDATRSTGVETIEQRPFIASYELREHVSLQLDLDSSFLYGIRTSDNAAERQLIGELFEILLSSQGNGGDSPTIPPTSVTEVVNLVAPLGQKKKIVSIPPGTRVELDAVDIPTFRGVQEAEWGALLDGIGLHLTSNGMKQGPIPSPQTNDVLKSIVEYLFTKLVATVSEYDSGDLINNLIMYQEAATRESVHRRFIVPTQLACFGHQTKMVDELSKSLPEVDTANLANRFLIEYVSAQPPQGTKIFSLETYDRLLAISSEIIQWGFASDLVHYELGDIELTMLGSGRVGRSESALQESRSAFLTGHITGFINASARRFTTSWNSSLHEIENDLPIPDDVQELNDAFRDETGLSLSETTAIFAEIYRIGGEQRGSIKSIPLTDLVRELHEILSIDMDLVTGAIDRYSLRSRSSFYGPPVSDISDVFPWKFDRDISFIRRPIILVGDGEDLKVYWGNRHLANAMGHLVQLCTSSKLKPKTLRLKQIISTRRNVEAREFEDEVGLVAQSLSPTYVRTHAKKLAGIRVAEEGEDIGDIDVLLVLPGRRLMIPIECKDLALARTAAEIRSQLRELFEGSEGTLSTVEKHLKRVAWLERNLDLVLRAEFGIIPKGRWRVTPLLVSDSELYATYLTSSPIPVCSIESFRLANAGTIWSLVT